jgi:Ca2+-binding RTX toxin-like protein
MAPKVATIYTLGATGGGSYDSQDGISDWNIASTNRMLVIGSGLYLYVAISNGDQINIGDYGSFGWGPLPADTTFSDTGSIGLDGPVDMELVNIGTSRFLVVAGLGDWALTTLQIDTEGEGVGTLSHVATHTDPDAADPRTPLRNVSDIDSFRVGSQTWVVAQSAVYGDLSLWSMATDGTLTMTDHEFGFGVPNNPNPALAAVAGAEIDGTGYVLGADATNLSLYSFDDTGALTLLDTEPSPALGPGQALSVGALEVVQTAGRTFVYWGGTRYGSDVLFMSEIKNGGLQPSVALAGVGINIRDLRTLTVDGVQMLFVADFGNSGFGSTATAYVVQPNGGLLRVARVDDDNDLFATVAVDAAVWNGVLHMTVTNAYSGNNNGEVNTFQIGVEDDSIAGNGKDNILIGLFGNDSLAGKNGADLLSGGHGDDRLSGGEGNDTLNGGEGADALFGGSDSLIGDALDYSTSTDGVEIRLSTGYAQGGHATGDTFEDIENLIGSDFADTLLGDGERNIIQGGSGSDEIQGSGGDDVLNGAGGDKGIDTGSDTLYGGSGNDALTGNGGQDMFFGGGGNDNLSSSATSDDRFHGGLGNDTLIGGRGNDQLYGDAGNDTLSGGLNNDTLSGGADLDLFVFTVSDPSQNIGKDLITDFTVGLDQIDLRGHGYDDLDELLEDVTFVDGNTVIDLAGPARITLFGLDPATLVSNNFIFT